MYIEQENNCLENKHILTSQESQLGIIATILISNKNMQDLSTEERKLMTDILTVFAHLFGKVVEQKDNLLFLEDGFASILLDLHQSLNIVDDKLDCEIKVGRAKNQ